MNTLSKEIFPRSFEDEEALEDFMTLPSQALVDDLARLDGDIMILGVGGKMGPTLARIAKRAAPDKRIIGVARFSDPAVAEKLQAWGIETITCDLLDEAAVANLPKVPNIVFMAGRKFGTTGSEELTWAMNVEVPAIVAKTFTDARVVVFSTGCVYPFVTTDSGGATEDAPAFPPAGEYAWSCLGRERMFDYFSRKNGNPVLMYRLNYAIDMRYGVLYDIASKVHNGEVIDLSMGHVNVIWQGDAIAQALKQFKVKNISVVSPYQPIGDEQVMKFFTETGFNVKHNIGLRCDTANSIAHTPQKDVLNLIVNEMDGDDVDAIVQVGTNMSNSDLFPTIEKMLGKPVIPINVATIWHALRAIGVNDKFVGKGWLMERF